MGTACGSECENRSASDGGTAMGETMSGIAGATVKMRTGGNRTGTLYKASDIGLAEQKRTLEGVVGVSEIAGVEKGRRRSTMSGVARCDGSG